ncbi:DUF2637 domain-containing protein [Streptomyces sp. NPDC090056]|uniref:DUF2637 domain-containing protein n=1 Tax=Streptomyces sp. NPDC090056 TaxID=3365934 RepID=UPI003817585C
MTITELPRNAADPALDPSPPTVVSQTPDLVSDASGSLSWAPEKVSEPESGTGTKDSPAALTTGQKWIVTAIVAAALALAGIGLYLSFAHVASFAHTELRFGTLTKGRLFAVGVDIGIMVMIAVDLVMAWLKRPISWIRYPVWLLTAATVVLNAASGAPRDRAWELMDYLAAGAHGVVPVLFIMVVEVGRDSIDRIVRPDEAERDAIPLIRWILAPIATCRIFRRMRLWGIDSYPEMIRRDQELIAYEQWLRRTHDGDLSKASEDELLPMTMAPYGYTVAEALALPDQQEQDAEERKEQAEARRRDAETRKILAEKRADGERARAQGELDAELALIAGETGKAQAHSQAQISAAKRAAEMEQAALETAVVAEARARAAEAARQEAAERKRKAVLDDEAAALERAAAEKRKAAAEADAVAAAEAQAVETQAAAEARRAAAEADRAAAETQKAAAETRRAAAEADRRAAEEKAAEEAALAAIEQSKKAAAEAGKAASEARLAAAETERRAVEIEDAAKLNPRERAIRKVVRMALTAGLNPEGLSLKDLQSALNDAVSIADVQHELTVSSTDTASKYRQEAAALLHDGYRPMQ